MSTVKKILLITSASNFEVQKRVIHAIDRKLKAAGGYAFYVFSSYGLYQDENLYAEGAKSIYGLLEEMDFDGCILGGNIFNMQMYEQFAEILREKNTPFITMNFSIKDAPFVTLDAYEMGCQLVEHLIEVHHCEKINVVGLDYDSLNSIHFLKAYQDVMSRHGLQVEERRMVPITVSIPNGRDLFHVFKEQKIDDAQAVICMHDVLAIGLCLEMEEQGYHVPEDLLICAVGRSSNSEAFRPDITGVDRMDEELAAKAAELLLDMINGKEIPRENFSKGKLYLGESCGCESEKSRESAKHFQDIVLAKIESGNQISQMMQYMDSLEKVNSFDEMGYNIGEMLRGVRCKEFVFCLNSRTIRYVTDESDFMFAADGKPFDRTMIAVSGYTERTGELKGHSFSIKKLLPMEAEEGDLLLFLPIHHKELAYGYIAFVNEHLPIDVYNYRICHESISISLENLHRQMLLRKNIEDLDSLHMQDALTGLHNVFGWKRFQRKYIEKGNYTVVSIDMDGLKKINDTYGHPAGNVALCVIADVIKEISGEDDLVARCGGDEFQILSLSTGEVYWENVRATLNEMIAMQAQLKELPYHMGASFGYCICREDQPISFAECCEIADKAMYENKRARKQCRED